MKFVFPYSSIGAILLVTLTACSPTQTVEQPQANTPSVITTEVKEPLVLPNGEPAEVTVQHCLISFSGALPGQTVRRSKEEAEKLAHDLLKLLRSGDSFDEIIGQFTNDSAPGIYSMTNIGVKASAFSDAVPRAQMVSGFGDVGFKLAVGEYGMAEYDPEKSKFGWHIIKRLK